MFLMYLFAWPCGSIKRGNRRALDIIMPFSTDDASCGSPQIVQVRIATGSASVFVMLHPPCAGLKAPRACVCDRV